MQNRMPIEETLYEIKNLYNDGKYADAYLSLKKLTDAVSSTNLKNQFQYEVLELTCKLKLWGISFDKALAKYQELLLKNIYIKNTHIIAELTENFSFLSDIKKQNDIGTYRYQYAFRIAQLFEKNSLLNEQERKALHSMLNFNIDAIDSTISLLQDAATQVELSQPSWLRRKCKVEKSDSLSSKLHVILADIYSNKAQSKQQKENLENAATHYQTALDKIPSIDSHSTKLQYKLLNCWLALAKLDKTTRDLYLEKMKNYIDYHKELSGSHELEKIEEEIKVLKTSLSQNSFSTLPETAQTTELKKTPLKKYTLMQPKKAVTHEKEKAHREAAQDLLDFSSIANATLPNPQQQSPSSILSPSRFFNSISPEATRQLEWYALSQSAHKPPHPSKRHKK